MPGMQAGFSCRTMRVHSRFLQQRGRDAEIFELEAGYCCSGEGRTVRAEQKCGAGLFATGPFLPLP